MTAATRAWLPTGALLDGALTRAVAEAASNWGKNWFERPEIGPVSVEPAPRRCATRSDALAFETTCHRMCLIADKELAIPLGVTILRAPHNAKWSASDRSYLSVLGERCLLGLLNKAAGAFGLKAKAGSTSGQLSFDEAIRFTLTISGRRCELFVAFDAASAVRKGYLPPASQLHLSTRANAIARHNVEVSALVGSQTISFSDLDALNVGDLLVLNRGPHDDVSIAVNRRSAQGRAWMLFKDGEDLKMKAASEGVA